MYYLVYYFQNFYINGITYIILYILFTLNVILVKIHHILHLISQVTPQDYYKHIPISCIQYTVICHKSCFQCSTVIDRVAISEHSCTCVSFSWALLPNLFHNPSKIDNIRMAKLKLLDANCSMGLDLLSICEGEGQRMTIPEHSKLLSRNPYIRLYCHHQCMCIFHNKFLAQCLMLTDIFNHNLVWNSIPAWVLILKYIYISVLCSENIKIIGIYKGQTNRKE